jgi:riboflavin biosynthesis pyrimidine reductase
MKTQYCTASSLDGSIADSRHSLDWLLQFQSTEETSYPGFIREIGALAMRSNTSDGILRHMAAAGGLNVWIAGGGELAGRFFDRGLLDEIIVQVAPVTLGSGMPLFPRRIASPSLRLTSAETFGDVFAELRCDVPRIRSSPWSER